MYNSLKSWLGLTCYIRPFVSQNGTGARTYGSYVSTACTVEGEIVTVKNETGSEVISTKQFYVDGNTAIKPKDRIRFEDYEKDVISIATFYDRGAANIKVVYL